MKKPRKKPTPARHLHLGLAIPLDLHNKLKAEARLCSRSVSSLVRLILIDYLDSPRPTR